MTPFRFLILLASITLVIIIGILIYVNSTISYGMPSLDQLENPDQNFASQVISADGKVLDHFFIERRLSIPFDSIPANFINALIAVEDRKFYDHWGIHIGRIFSAAIKDILAGEVKEGASTITMQLARNLFFTHATTIERKLKEAITAVEIEKQYTKNEILEMYANTVWFGRGAYGIKVAANTYLGKEPSELTLSECAYLVGMLKNPNKFNGINDMDLAVQRRNLVLYLMEDVGFISAGERYEAKIEPLNLNIGSIKERNKVYMAPHFVEMVRNDLKNSPNILGHDIYRDGLTIYTTLDSRMQEAAEKAVESHLADFQERFRRAWSWDRNKSLLDELITKAIRNTPEYAVASSKERKALTEKFKKNKKFVDSVKNAATTIQIGVVIIDPFDGSIKAMVGASPKFMKENPNAKYSLNHAAQIKRQPGSSFKPFVYASALEQGLNPSAYIECGPYSYELPNGDVWEPRGTGGCEEGETRTLYSALVSSINTVSARLVTMVTTPFKVISVAKRMGIDSPLMAVPAIALGAGGNVSPLEMTSAFGSFATEGIHIKPFSIKRVEDKYGNIVYEKKKADNARYALKPRIIHLMTKMLQGVVDIGTGRAIRTYFPDVDAAGKTGTTNDYTDAWFVGYTPQLSMGLWLGFDDQRVTFTGEYGYASYAAAPLWGKIMANIYKDKSLPYKQKHFTFSADIDSLQIISSPEAESASSSIHDSTFIRENDEPVKKKRQFPPLNY
jgi:penicillin-binding protein 1A